MLFLVEIIRWGASIALFAPLIVHPAFFFPFVVPKTVFFWIFTEIMLVAWLLLAIPNKQFRPKWNAISIAFSIFLFVTIFTSFTGVNAERSFWSTFERMGGTINWIHLFLFFIVITSTFKTLQDWRKLLTASFIAACAVALPFVLERVGIRVIPFETRNGSTIGNSSFMATYLLFGVFFGIWLVVKAKNEWQKALYAAGLGLLVLTVLLSTAYGALVSMFGGFYLIVLCWLFFSAKAKFARPLAIVLFAAGVFIAAVIGYGTLTQNKAIVSKLPYFFSDNGTIGARQVVWEMAWQGIKERPILGWGPENFNVVFTKYFNPCMVLSKCGGEVWFDRTHNNLLDQLVHSGIMGLLAYLAIFGAVFWGLLKVARRYREEWLLPGVIVAALASYFVQNLLVFDMPSSYQMFAFILAFAGGITAIAFPSKTRDVRAQSSIKNPTPFTTVAVGLVGIYFLFSWGVQSLQAANWGIAINRSSMPPDRKIELYKKSISVTRLGNRQIPEFFSNNMVNWIYSENKPPEHVVSESIEIMRKTLEKNPIDFRHYLILGNLYAAAKDYNPEYLNEAEKYLTRAVELSPKNQQGYTSLGQTYRMKGEHDKGILMFKKAAELEPLYERPQFSLADAYVYVERYGDAKDVYEKMFQNNMIPSDINTLSKIVKVYEELEDYDNAIMWFREVVESKAGKDNGNARLMLAELYQKGGYKDEARAEAMKAKELDPALSKEVEELLKSLK